MLASFIGSTDYTSATSSATFTISQASPTVSVVDNSGVYNTAAFAASDTVAGVNQVAGASLENVTPTLTYYSGTSATGTALSGAPTTVGTYTVLASFIGSTDYTSGAASTTFSISQATPKVKAIDASGAYTTSAFTASTASIEGGTPSLTYYSGTSATGTALSGAPTTVGTYTVLASFIGSTDYTSGMASTTFTISQAVPSVSVTDGGGTYSGAAFAAGDTVSGVGSDLIAAASLESVAPTSELLLGHECDGDGFEWRTDDGGDVYGAGELHRQHGLHQRRSAITTFTISQANPTQSLPTFSVTDASGNYTGSAFTATSASIESVAPSLTYYSGTSATGTALSGAPTTVGTYTVLASFIGSTDYTSATSSATFTISQAAPTLSLTDNSGAYNAAAFAATDTVAGVSHAFGASLEGTIPSLTYYSGTSATGTALSGAPTTVGTYTVLASFAGSTDYKSCATSTTFTINQVAPSVSVTDGGGTYSGAAFAAGDTVSGVGSQSAALASLESVTPTLSYYSGTSATGTALSGAPTTVGTYTVLASFIGSTDYTSASASSTFTISQANPTQSLPTFSVTDPSGKYTGSAFTAVSASIEGVTPSLTYYVGASATGTALSGAPTTVGTYTVLASFIGSTDFTSGTTSATFTISQATPTVSVIDNGGTVSASNFPASDTVAGVNQVAGASLENVAPTLTYYSGTSVSTSTQLSGAPSNIGTYTVVASFAGSTDYTSASASTTYTIVPSGVLSTPTLSVVDNSGFYNDAAYVATVTVAGMNHMSQASLENVTPSLTYYTGTSASTSAQISSAPTTVGTYTVLASFAGSTSYMSGAASTTFSISQAAPSVSVTDASGNYTGSAFTATSASIESVAPTLTYYSGTSATGTALSGAPTTVGTYTVLASFIGSTDYTSGTTSATFTISQAAPTLSLTDNSGAYNAAAFAATDTVAGVNHASGASLEGMTPSLTYYSGTSATGTALSGAPTTVGTYTVLASFAGSTDYKTCATSTTFTISQTAPSVSVTDASGTYNATAFTATTASIEGVTAGLTYYSGTSATGTALSGAPTTVGTYTVLASFIGSTDFTSGTASTTFTISQSTPSVSVTDHGVTYSGAAFAAGDTVSGVSQIAGASLESVTPTLSYYSGTSATGTALSGAPTTVGTYTVLASFIGSSDYTSSSASTTFTISQANPTQSLPTFKVSDYSGAYTGSAFTAVSASIEGVTPSLTYYSGTSATGTTLSGAPTTVGTYTVLASFIGSTDYTSGMASTTFTISQATPSVSVTDGGGTYSGAAFAAGDTVSGVSQVAGASLESVTPTLSYYSGTSATGTALSGAPTTVGTYTVLASFIGSTDYTSASTSTTFTISQANPTQSQPTLSVTDASGNFTGAAFTATSASIEGVTPSLTYYSGTSATGTALSGAPTTVGTYTVLASFIGSTDYTSGTTSATFTISQAAPTLSLTDNSGAYNGAAFSATDTVAGVSHAFGASLEGTIPSLTYYSGTSATGTALSGAPTTVGTYTVLSSFAGSTDYKSCATSTTFTINQTTPSVSVTDHGGTYSGAAFAAGDTVSGVSQIAGASLESVTPTLSYYSGTSATGTALSGAPTTVGTYTVLASFAGSSDYTSASSNTTFTISQANPTQSPPTLSVTDASGKYTGSAFAATSASIEGGTPSLTYYSGTSATGTALSGAPTTVGTYTVLASFIGSTDYTSGMASTTFAISQATPTVSVTDGGGTYSGAAFAAGDTVSGVGSDLIATASLESVAPSLSYYSGTSATGTALSGAPTTVGTYTVLASFIGSTDYTSASAITTFTISQANPTQSLPTFSVTDASGNYTGSAFTATSASIESVAPTLTYYSGTSATGTALSGAPTTVGTYTVLASFIGSTDYTSGTTSATFTISQAAPTLSLTDNSGAYNGAAFSATDTVAGVSHAFGASLEGTIPSLTYYSGTSATGTALSGAPTTVGTYTVLSSFAGSTDYKSCATSTTFTINQTTPSVSVTDHGGTYSGAAFAAGDTVSGVSQIAGASLESVTPTLSYYSGTSATGTALSGAPTTVGTYTVLASFAGSSDYTSASSSTTFTISQANPTQSLPTFKVSDYSGAYTGSAFTAVSASIEGVTPSLTYYSGTSATGTALSGAPTTVGTYTVLASFIGSTDFTSGTTSTTFTITPATPTVSVTDNGGTYNSSGFPATDTVAGVNQVAGASLEGTTPSLTYYSGTSVSTSTQLSGAPANVGTYTVLASFAGSTDYTSTSASTTFTIVPSASQTTPTLSVFDPSGPYNDNAFVATATVAGTNHVSGVSLENVIPTLAYYSGTSASGSALSGAPSGVGTYTVLASFSGSTDYTSGTASTTFTISTAPPATPTVSVFDNGGTYNGAAFTASDTVAGSNEIAGASLENVTPTLTYYSGTSASTSTQLSGAPTTAGTYTVLASFIGSTDYTSASASTTFTINKATPSVSLTDNNGPYTGAAFMATTASIEGVTPTLTYYSGTSATGTALSGAPTTVGTYSVLASFIGSTDYTSGSASVTFTISKAAPTLTVTDASGPYTDAAFAAIANGGVGATPTLAYYSGTSANGTALSGAPTTVGTYTVLATLAATANYASNSASTTFTISQAAATVVVTDASNAYNAAAFVATETVAGVGASRRPQAAWKGAR